MSKPIKSWANIVQKNNQTNQLNQTNQTNQTNQLDQIDEQLNKLSNVFTNIPPTLSSNISSNISSNVSPKVSSNIQHFNINNNFREMADFFHENGFIILDNAIPPEMLQRLRNDLNQLNQQSTSKSKSSYKNSSDRHIVHKCFFEQSKSTVDLVANSKIYDFAAYLISDVPGNRGNSLKAHLIHNNAFSVPPGGRGQAPSWHTDDPLEQVILPPNTILPSYVKLPVLVVTYMIWLSDCIDPSNGPTYVVPGSHRFGSVVDPKMADELGIPMCGKAGTAVLINSQVWHRGCENNSGQPRDTLQLTFARRMIGHKFKSIMNYHMPDHVTRNMNDETKERFGFLQGGAYS